jgi:hypothetical protein
MPPSVARVKGDNGEIRLVLSQYAEKFAYKAKDRAGRFAVTGGQGGLEAKKCAIGLGMAVNE